MDNPPVSGVIVHVLRQSPLSVEFLYLQRSGGRYKGEWWPVAGTCNEHEAPITCAIRELKEETGLDAQRLYHLGIEVPHIDRTTKLKGYVAFVNNTASVTLNYEHSDYQWLSTEQVLALLPETAQPFIRHVHNHFILNAADESLRLVDY